MPFRKVAPRQGWAAICSSGATLRVMFFQARILFFAETKLGEVWLSSFQPQFCAIQEIIPRRLAMAQFISRIHWISQPCIYQQIMMKHQDSFRSICPFFHLLNRFQVPAIYQENPEVCKAAPALVHMTNVYILRRLSVSTGSSSAQSTTLRKQNRKNGVHTDLIQMLSFPRWASALPRWSSVTTTYTVLALSDVPQHLEKSRGCVRMCIGYRTIASHFI